MNKSYNELIEKYKKLKTEIDNPFDFKWINDLFKDLKSASEVEFNLNGTNIYL